MKVYGTITEPLNAALLRQTEAHLGYPSLSDFEALVRFLIFHPQVAIDARPCQLPCSQRAQAVLQDGTVITALMREPSASVEFSIS